ncbi:MAG TPA: gas vesicle protein [Acidimicrobiales bacterium]|nr:gas vesicle protein [Acidimicrobiales bacterium]
MNQRSPATVDLGAACGAAAGTPARPSDARRVTLVDLADRLLGRGVVVSGDITLSVADVDLVYVGLRLFLASAETADRLASGETPGLNGGENRSP